MRWNSASPRLPPTPTALPPVSRGVYVPLPNAMAHAPTPKTPRSDSLEVGSCMVDAIPGRTKVDLRALQEADPCISRFWWFWRQDRPPSPRSQKKESKAFRQLVKQWPRIQEVEGVLYRAVQAPPSRNSVLQLLLPKALQAEVLTSLHANHGHQGVDITT